MVCLIAHTAYDDFVYLLVFFELVMMYVFLFNTGVVVRGSRVGGGLEEFIEERGGGGAT